MTGSSDQAKYTKERLTAIFKAVKCASGVPHSSSTTMRDDKKNIVTKSGKA